MTTAARQIRFERTPRGWLMAACAAIVLLAGCASVRSLSHYQPGDPVFLAGSTQSGEEQVAVAAYRSVVASHPGTKLIVVPRHPERFNGVFELCGREGFAALRRSAGEPVGAGHQVVHEDDARAVVAQVADRRLGEDAGGLLEGGRGEEGVDLEAGAGDAQEEGAPYGRLAALGAGPLARRAQ